MLFRKIFFLVYNPLSMSIKRGLFNVIKNIDNNKKKIKSLKNQIKTYFFFKTMNRNDNKKKTNINQLKKK